MGSGYSQISGGCDLPYLGMTKVSRKNNFIEEIYMMTFCKKKGDKNMRDF